MKSEKASASRLSGIQTSWSLVRQAHDQAGDDATKARHDLFGRYAGASRRYLGALVKSTELADELFQEFALRFLRGDLHRADEALGSFRRYVKSVLVNLARGRFRAGRRREVPLDEEPAILAADQEDLFDRAWRDELLSHAWQELAEFEQSNGRPYCTLLKLKVERPHATSAELAKRLNEALPSSSFTETATRKLLQRAREQFARLLARRVRDTLPDLSREGLLDELRELNLLSYCESVV